MMSLQPWTGIEMAVTPSTQRGLRERAKLVKTNGMWLRLRRRERPRKGPINNNGRNTGLTPAIVLANQQVEIISSQLWAPRNLRKTIF